ncbi:hypothetical protein B0H17DRAFT_1045155 [Mycena rosella]|uniref:Uncharacterized protein n=1 Tax=Mycena rosella TaxID=1033263 RepID=A0AAD7GMR3_MYCRO|nr:hypothetical protein B0H17DRAFT_1045155 [Mycena rosella]
MHVSSRPPASRTYSALYPYRRSRAHQLISKTSCLRRGGAGPGPWTRCPSSQPPRALSPSLFTSLPCLPFLLFMLRGASALRRLNPLTDARHPAIATSHLPSPRSAAT